MAKLMYNVLSNVTCNHIGCNKRIKQRLIEKKKPNTLCYNHYKMKEEKRSHFIDTNQRDKRVKAGLPVKAGLRRLK